MVVVCLHYTHYLGAVFLLPSRLDLIPDKAIRRRSPYPWDACMYMKYAALYVILSHYRWVGRLAGDGRATYITYIVGGGGT